MKLLRRRVESAIDTGMEYWYYTKHGVQPGSIPKGVNVLEIIDDEHGTFVLLDKMLTTKELNDYDLKEDVPNSIKADTQIDDESEKRRRFDERFKEYDKPLTIDEFHKCMKEMREYEL